MDFAVKDLYGLAFPLFVGDAWWDLFARVWFEKGGAVSYPAVLSFTDHVVPALVRAGVQVERVSFPVLVDSQGIDLHYVVQDYTTRLRLYPDRIGINTSQLFSDLGFDCFDAQTSIEIQRQCCQVVVRQGNSVVGHILLVLPDLDGFSDVEVIDGQSQSFS